MWLVVEGVQRSRGGGGEGLLGVFLRYWLFDGKNNVDVKEGLPAASRSPGHVYHDCPRLHSIQTA